MTTESLVFGVGELLCALPLRDVVETSRPLPVQHISGANPGLLGVSVIRGRAVPVLDTARVLGAGPATPTRFVTTSTAYGSLAFATGDVIGVRDVTPSSDAAPGSRDGVVAGVGVLDGRPLLFLRATERLGAGPEFRHA